jgi:hypothetical protein
MKMYGKFAAMIATSKVVMFGLMYLNTYQLDHVTFSETRAYMAIVLGATMAVVMLAYMLKMYPNRRVSIGIFLGLGRCHGESRRLEAGEGDLERRPSCGRRPADACRVVVVAFPLSTGDGINSDHSRGRKGASLEAGRL